MEFPHGCKPLGGTRYMVLFSFAEGDKVRFVDDETYFQVGVGMAKFHELTFSKKLDRTTYGKATLTTSPYKQLTKYFSEKLAEMQFISKFTAVF
ncbi:MAG: hypothetical protein QMB03_12405 [Spirosomataceae bacterium]